MPAIRVAPTLGAFAAAFMVNAVWADDLLPAARYKLKQDQPNTGSHILRDKVIGNSIPLNRRYGEMTAEERRKVKDLYEAMPEADEPPFPIDGLTPVYEAVAKIVQKLQARGDMTLVVNVDASGQATGVQVLKAAEPELTRAVASILILTKYKPAVCAGAPCAMAYPFRITATLRY
jgi:hypothetical protein